MFNMIKYDKNQIHNRMIVYSMVFHESDGPVDPSHHSRNMESSHYERGLTDELDSRTRSKGIYI